MTTKHSGTTALLGTLAFSALVALSIPATAQQDRDDMRAKGSVTAQTPADQDAQPKTDMDRDKDADQTARSENSNGKNAEDRDFGRDRAEDRRSDRATDNAEARAGTADTDTSRTDSDDTKKSKDR